MKVDEREIDRIEAIILSMTPLERRRPELIKGSRRLRIARGSGTSVQAVNQLVKQFAQVRKVMRQIGRGRMPDLGALMRQRAERQAPRAGLAGRSATRPGLAPSKLPLRPTGRATCKRQKGHRGCTTEADPRGRHARTRSGGSSSPTSAPSATGA